MVKGAWNRSLWRGKTVLFYPKGTFKLGQWQGTRSFFNFKKCDVIETKWFFYILSFDAVDAVNLECDPRPCRQGTRKRCCTVDKWTHFCNFVGDDLGIVKQMSFWRIGDWTWQTFCYMLITDSISQLIDGVSIVLGRLCLCHSVTALGWQFSWNWSKVAVNRVLLNAARAVWSPVFFTHHRPHHVSGVRGPENGSLFFRWIAYVIYSGSCLIPLRRSPSATAIKTILKLLFIIFQLLISIQNGISILK